MLEQKINLNQKEHIDLFEQNAFIILPTNYMIEFNNKDK